MIFRTQDGRFEECSASTGSSLAGLFDLRSMLSSGPMLFNSLSLTHSLTDKRERESEGGRVGGNKLN